LSRYPVYYSATIFAMAGFDNPTATGLIVSGTNLFFTIVAMFLLDRVGKRRILLCTQPGMVAGLALAAVAFAKMTADTGGKLIEGQDYPKNWSNMMLGMMVVFIAFYATGSGNITWVGLVVWKQVSLMVSLILRNFIVYSNAPSFSLSNCEEWDLLSWLEVSGPPTS
jgi:hypothetical protein